MNSFRSFILVVALLITTHTIAREPLPVESWLNTDVINASLSHDGTYLGVLREDKEREGHRIIWVYTFDDDGSLKIFKRINSENMRIGGFTWLSDHHFIMGLRQQVRSRIQGFNQGVYSGKSQVVDLAEGTFVALPVENPGIEHMLPNEPFKIIVSEDTAGSRNGRRSVGGRGSVWHSYFEFDLNSMRKKLLLKAKFMLQDVRFDIDGKPDLAAGFDLDSLETVFQYRPDPNDSQWVEFARTSIEDFDVFFPAGIDRTKPHHEYVIAHNGKDKRALWSYDKKNATYGELVYGRNDVDVWGTFNHSNTLAHYGEVAGVSVRKEGRTYEYFPEYELEGAIHNQFSNLVDNSFATRVTSVSRDGQTMVVFNFGPKSPPTFYIFRNGNFTYLGTTLPDVANDDLSETTYIEYPARDGLTIRAT